MYKCMSYIEVANHNQYETPNKVADLISRLKTKVDGDTCPRSKAMKALCVPYSLGFAALLTLKRSRNISLLLDFTDP